MDLATRWSNLFVGMSPASFFNFSFLPKYGVYFLQALGYTLLTEKLPERRGVMIPVTGISCKYRQPSRYDDTLEITTYVTRFSPARVEFRYECRRKGSPEILTEGTSAHAFVDAKTFRPLNFRKALPDIYEKLEKEAEKDLALCAT